MPECGVDFSASDLLDGDCGTEAQWEEITKGSSWDYYSPGLFKDYEQIAYTVIFNYKDS